MLQNIPCRVNVAKNLMTLVALLFAALVVSAPAAARGAHGLSHAGKPVASSEHHHHGNDGSVATHDADTEKAPESDEGMKGQIGHSHMSGTAFDAIPTTGTELWAAFDLRASRPATANTPAFGTLGWSPQKRPPRAA